MKIDERGIPILPDATLQQPCQFCLHNPLIEPDCEKCGEDNNYILFKRSGIY